eukprot:GGOE01015750.1.p2 GENE.GGOE01015750.1~~GGOE01015750.1.p2  ORF type:complete len:143 (+),score=8.45 GGOE01015750.1:134-562(+)
MAGAVTTLSPGTTVHLAAGSVLRGTYVASTGCRILGTSPAGSALPVISGAMPVTGEWHKGPGGSYWASVPPECERPTQLFVGGRRMTPARHPNGDASLRVSHDAPKRASLLRYHPSPCLSPSSPTVTFTSWHHRACAPAARQ